jgi:hypothetical protein
MGLARIGGRKQGVTHSKSNFSDVLCRRVDLLDHAGAGYGGAQCAACSTGARRAEVLGNNPDEAADLADVLEAEITYMTGVVGDLKRAHKLLQIRRPRANLRVVAGRPAVIAN